MPWTSAKAEITPEGGAAPLPDLPRGGRAGRVPAPAAHRAAGVDPRLTKTFSSCLPGPPLTGPLLAFSSFGSTQTVCRELGLDGAPEGLVVLADHQTDGRGRRGRSWEAPPGSALLFSCLLRPALEPARWPELGLAAACAVADGVAAATGVRADLKWPNDVVVAGRKLAGILAEGVVGPAPLVVLGIGINVSQGSTDWSAELRTRATSIAETGGRVDRPALLAAVLAELARRYSGLVRDGFDPIREAWRRRAVLGHRVSGSGIEGVAVDIAPSGGLLVREDDGRAATINAGEIGVLDPVPGSG